eukprot:COSAG05_NODE_103_length_19033_cov_99.004278_7_plen_78_part_00
MGDFGHQDFKTVVVRKKGGGGGGAGGGASGPTVAVRKECEFAPALPCATEAVSAPRMSPRGPAPPRRRAAAFPPAVK